MDEESTPRERLTQLIAQYPGLHVREIARRARMSEALAAYHLNLLVQDKRIEVAEDGMFRRFYVPGQRVPSDDREWMALLRRPVALHIALHLLTKGPATHTELTE